MLENSDADKRTRFVNKIEHRFHARTQNIKAKQFICNKINIYLFITKIKMNSIRAKPVDAIFIGINGKK